MAKAAAKKTTDDKKVADLQAKKAKKDAEREKIYEQIALLTPPAV